MPLPRIFTIVVAILVVAACAPPPFNPAAEQQKLLQRDADWAELAAAGKDVEKTASYWSDDALIIPQGQPTIEGKTAIRAFVASSFKIPGFKIHWKSEKPVFSPDGKLAYMTGTNATTLPGPGGTLVTVPGRGITVWRLDPDGLWRCVVDIWNDPPSAAASPLVPQAGASAATPASAVLMPVYSAEETALFKALAAETITALDAGKQGEMIAKLTDLETAWDAKEDVLKPKDPAAWTMLDKTLDRGISTLRSSRTDLPTGKAALQDLIKKLDQATQH